MPRPRLPPEVKLERRRGYQRYWKLNAGIPRAVPAKAHPLVRELIKLMIKYRVTYQQLHERSGVSFHGSISHWRRGRGPQLKAIEACFHAIGYDIIVRPKTGDEAP